ncbi:unnamed protein product [Amoebophrya sp. A25]|nr:unnamed protein product [Amoebophrya sp. A25]|eukprot:GSA25T00008992001.1
MTSVEADAEAFAPPGDAGSDDAANHICRRGSDKAMIKSNVVTDEVVDVSPTTAIPAGSLLQQPTRSSSGKSENETTSTTSSANYNHQNSDRDVVVKELHSPSEVRQIVQEHLPSAEKSNQLQAGKYDCALHLAQEMNTEEPHHNNHVHAGGFRYEKVHLTPLGFVLLFGVVFSLLSLLAHLVVPFGGSGDDGSLKIDTASTSRSKQQGSRAIGATSGSSGAPSGRPKRLKQGVGAAKSTREQRKTTSGSSKRDILAEGTILADLHEDEARVPRAAASVIDHDHLTHDHLALSDEDVATVEAGNAFQEGNAFLEMALYDELESSRANMGSITGSPLMGSPLSMLQTGMAMKVPDAGGKDDVHFLTGFSLQNIDECKREAMLPYLLRTMRHSMRACKETGGCKTFEFYELVKTGKGVFGAASLLDAEKELKEGRPDMIELFVHEVYAKGKEDEARAKVFDTYVVPMMEVQPPEEQNKKCFAFDNPKDTLGDTSRGDTGEWRANWLKLDKTRILQILENQPKNGYHSVGKLTFRGNSLFETKTERLETGNNKLESSFLMAGLKKLNGEGAGGALYAEKNDASMTIIGSFGDIKADSSYELREYTHEITINGKDVEAERMLAAALEPVTTVMENPEQAQAAGLAFFQVYTLGDFSTWDDEEDRGEEVHDYVLYWVFRDQKALEGKLLKGFNADFTKNKKLDSKKHAVAEKAWSSRDGNNMREKMLAARGDDSHRGLQELTPDQLEKSTKAKKRADARRGGGRRQSQRWGGEGRRVDHREKTHGLRWDWSACDYPFALYLHAHVWPRKGGHLWLR